MTRSSYLLLACLVSLSGCADIIEGRSQEITVQSEPSGATCNLMRNGAPLGTIQHTPDAIYVEKTKDAITITCSKSGYQNASYLNASGYPENNWLYILVGGPIGWGIGSAAGADNLYTSPVMITSSNNKVDLNTPYFAFLYDVPDGDEPLCLCREYL